MIRSRMILLTLISVIVLSMPLTYAQDLSTYRGFRLGMNLPAAAKQADAKPSEAKVIYQRPAVIQELEWRPQRSYGSPVQADPVNVVVLTFYEGELYRILISYDQDRTKGLTDEDLIEAISAKYGTPTMPAAKIVSSPPSQAYIDSERVIARWEDLQYSFNLFRFSYGSAPGMLVFSKRLDVLAQKATAEALRLNEQEAPQREIDRQKKQDDEKRAEEQKAKPANKANFHP
jgi:hypothetical protein